MKKTLNQWLLSKFDSIKSEQSRFIERSWYERWMCFARPSAINLKSEDQNFTLIKDTSQETPSFCKVLY